MSKPQQPDVTIEASDFIQEADRNVDPTLDEGRVPVLEADGKLDGAFLRTPPPQVVAFTSSGTWTKNDGLKYVIIEGVGGGRTGGTGSNQGNGGGGGGAGGYFRKLILASALGATETITVGAMGAATSFGSHATGNGAGALHSNDFGGPGGTATGGDINMTGSPGLSFVGQEKGGNGGASYFGGGGKGASFNSVNLTGGVTNSGSGGGGGGDSLGGAGASGIVIVTEYY